MPATPIQISLFNATINPYEGKRPKVVNKLYSIKDMFEEYRVEFSYGDTIKQRSAELYIDHVH